MVTILATPAIGYQNPRTHSNLHSMIVRPIQSKPTLIPAYSSLLDLTHTLGPRVASFNKSNPESPIKLLAKAEFRNPASCSHKDRIASNIIRKAAKRGELTDRNGNKKTIVAASSGNTGHALAFIGSQMGYNVVIITNKACSKEKCYNIVNTGAELWMAEDLPDMFPAILKSVSCYMEQEWLIAQQNPHQYFSVNQYSNIDNMDWHCTLRSTQIKFG